jgi:DNA invertase Pin-like site-specific DNA recombinase
LKKQAYPSDAVYCRVSTIDQDTAAQELDLKLWVGANADLALWFRDKFTGSEMRRPAFDQLMESVRAGRTKRVVVWRLDRLGRTAKGLTELFDELTSLGATLVSIRDGLDLSTPAGRLLAHVLAAVAQYEWEVIRERIVAGVAAARARGQTWGGSPPGRRSARVSAQAQAARDLRERGRNVSEIGRALGLCRNTVYRLLKEDTGNAE